MVFATWQYFPTSVVVINGLLQAKRAAGVQPSVSIRDQYQGMSDVQITRERRAHPRYAVRKNGLFVDKISGNSLYCEIVDMSASGARVKLANSFVLSDRAELVVLSEAVCYDARVVWREGNFLGLSLENGLRQVTPAYK